MGKSSLVFVIFVISVLSACVPSHRMEVLIQQSVQYMTWSKREAALSSIHSFVARGAVRFQRGEASPHFLQYLWSQESSDSYTLSLYGPLHVLLLQIQEHKGVPHIMWRGKEVAKGREAVQLWMQKNIGYDLPVQHLTYWMRGLSGYSVTLGARKQPQVSYDAFGRLAQLTQGVLTVQFREYFPWGKYSVPKKIFWQYGGDQVLLVARLWQLHA